jgi:creatinine amidohydrolase
MIKALFVAIEALTGAVIMTGTMILLLPMVAASRDRVTGIEFEKMTWVEVKAALVAGKTTALIYTGGVEERGPQNVNGGHNLMACCASIRMASATIRMANF